MATYVAVDMRIKSLAPWIGIGFSLVDIAVLLVDGSQVSGMSAFLAVLLGLNVIQSLLFHPGAAAFLKWGQLAERKGCALLTAVVMHAIADGGLVFTDFYIYFHPASYYSATMIRPTNISTMPLMLERAA